MFDDVDLPTYAFCRNSVAVENLEVASGGKGNETLEEIRDNLSTVLKKAFGKKSAKGSKTDGDASLDVADISTHDEGEKKKRGKQKWVSSEAKKLAQRRQAETAIPVNHSTQFAGRRK